MSLEKKEIFNEVRRVLYAEAEAVGRLAETVDSAAIEEAVKVLAACKGRILLAGCGTSAQAAKKIAHSLSCIERPAAFLIPSDAVHGGLGLLQKDDVLILISKGGNTSELTKLIPSCRAKGAYLIGVTENENSTIAEESDLLLRIKVEKEPDEFNMLATASTLAVIAVFDAICITLMKYTDYTKEQFAVIHPSGAVGDRLLGKVK